MRKLKLIIGIFIFLPIFSSMTITNIAKAASGDFYNITKRTKYSRVNLVADKALAQQLQDEMDSGDIVGKELNDGNVIDYNAANNLFISLLSSMTVQEALISATSSQNVKIDKTTTGIDSFGDATLEEDFDVVIIE